MSSAYKSLILFCIIALISLPKAFSIDTKKEIGEQFDKSKRVEWINNCRGGNNGINWQLIDNETRQSKYDLLVRASNNKNKNSLQSDFLANGRIEGNWIEKGSNNNAGRIRNVDLDLENNLIYAFSDGGNIFRGTLEGKNWTCLNNGIKFDNPHIIKIIKFDGKKRILAVTYNGKISIYSDDEGQTWYESNGLDNPKKWGGVRRCIVANDKKQTIYLLGNEWDYGTDWKEKVVIYCSKDHGVSFERILFEPGNLSMMDMWADGYDTDKAYYFKNDSIFNLVDGTIKFRKKYDLSLVSSPTEITVSGANDNGIISFMLCVRSAANQRNNFIVSYNQGATWEYKGSIDKNKFMMTSFSTSTYFIDNVYFGSVNLHMSIDGGTNWSPRNEWTEYYPRPESMLHADVPSVQFFRMEDESELMFIGTDGGLYMSEDYGANVKNISMLGLNVSQYYSVLTAKNNPNVIYVGAQDQGFQRTNQDSGKALGFRQLFSGDYGSITSSDEGNSLWSVYPTFVLYMRNAPIFDKSMELQTWEFEGYGWDWMTPTRAVHGQPNQAYAIGGDKNNGSFLWSFWSTGSNQLTATKQSRNFSNETVQDRLVTLELSPTNKIFCASDRGIMHITTDGENWQDYTIFPGDNVFRPNSIAFDPTNENIIYVGGRGYNTPGAFVSFDGGKSYKDMSDGLPHTYTNSLAVSSDGKLVFAATSVGPYVFLTWLNRWFSMATLNSPDQDFRWVEYVASSKTARFATYGRGIWDFKIDNIITSIEDNEKPINFEVCVYPNPMKDNSTIKFNLPISGVGTVKIFDINGHEIIKLHDGPISSGNNTFNWDGRNCAGMSTSNGTYLCLVSISGYTAYTKIEIYK